MVRAGSGTVWPLHVGDRRERKASSAKQEGFVDGEQERAGVSRGPSMCLE